MRSLAITTAVAAGALALAATGCGSDSQQSEVKGAAASSPLTVKMGDSFFEPKTVRLRRGQTLKWVNQGKLVHTVKGKGFFSRAVDSKGKFEHRFTRSGSFKYVCTLHPGMIGTAVVK